MKNYNEIMAKVEKTELSVKELRELVEALIEENTMLREQLGMSTSNDTDHLLIVDVFNDFSLKDDHNGTKTALRNGLARSGYKVIGDFRNKTITDLIKIRSTGASRCAVLIILLEHYGINIELPDLEIFSETDDYKTIQKLYEELPKYRDKVVFKK